MHKMIGIFFLLVICNVTGRAFADSGTVMVCDNWDCNATIVSTSSTKDTIPDSQTVIILE